ncbi:rifin [Plasmodium reichenowi]|uniref:Rifin n=1 Tax=Plasmodium reichenowi TaxID=5854 RepID=A0A060RM09_PLARE|nr:rifin [Plasmodium reichenowi]
MKVHYINALLFALPLNILENNQRNHKSILQHIRSTRLLCECDIYEPANYDSDPQMKSVMENFNKQTQKRFEEYDERMKTTRQKCKEQCDKEIKKIILKDKLEKQMTEQLTTLETKIDTNDIPTCIFEKSLADKVQKNCLKSGYGLGTVAPTVGLFGSVSIGAWKNAALDVGIKTALNAAAANISAAAEAAGIQAGKDVVIDSLKVLKIDKLVSGICEQISSAEHYNHVTTFTQTIINQRQAICGAGKKILGEDACNDIAYNLGTMLRNGNPNLPDNLAVPKVLKGIVAKAKTTADFKTAEVTLSKTTEFKETYMAAVDTTYASYQTAIIASIVAIVVIVLIMIIIYLVLRYRRKKKMKKKLQYIKLLEE